MRPVPKLAICVLALINFWLPLAAGENAKELESTFRHLYEGKLLSLRTPYFGKSLDFDSSGVPVNHLVAGPWSTCGLLQVQRFRVSQHGIEIDGKRVILALRLAEKGRQAATPAKPQVIPILTTRDVRVRLEMSPENQQQINNSLGQIFQGGRLLDRVSRYWKPITSDLEVFRGNSPQFGLTASPSPSPGAVVGELEGNRTVYEVCPGITPPRAIESPDPEYTPAARDKRIEGTTVLSVVVNQEGFPEMLEIVRGLGQGLDIQALATVANWRFDPALKEGKPVAVLIHVEVTFRLG